jgi:hypothetical protein
MIILIANAYNRSFLVYSSILQTITSFIYNNSSNVKDDIRALFCNIKLSGQGHRNQEAYQRTYQYALQKQLAPETKMNST